MKFKPASKIIREHRVFGREFTVIAASEEQAREQARNITSDHIWEIYIKDQSKNLWVVFVAKHQDAFALND